ncbi:hypothetical protein V5R04_08780 [Jonesiaceae bacterium BS-20]|uniref:Uncharacterized protein n=1 Tax=Jonesiaceae bacterium BS-20 TaxID=3120821 RepID=A0AAU7DQ84_9MICO
MHQNTEYTLETFTARTRGTPYVLEQTKNGLKVSLNVVDHDWASTLAAHQVREFYEVLVKFDVESGFAKITPQQRELKYQLGANGAVIGASVGGEVFRGRIIHSKSSISTSKNGVPNNVVRSQASWNFDGQELQDFVTKTLIECGWQVDEGMAGKVGMIAAIFGGIVAVIAGVGALVLTLVGR